MSRPSKPPGIHVPLSCQRDVGGRVRGHDGLSLPGYTIIANVGEQPSDLLGGHAGKTFSLPDLRTVTEKRNRTILRIANRLYQHAGSR